VRQVSASDSNSTGTTSIWSCETYVKTGKMMPDDGYRAAETFDAIFLGAVGHPRVPDHISLWAFSFPSAAISGST